MRHGTRLPRFGLWLLLMFPCLLFTGCAGDANDLATRLTVANLLAGSASQALTSAIDARTIDPTSQTAAAIMQTLDAAETALDGAGAALRAGLPDVAVRNLGAAEAQLAGLQPLLPGMEGGQ
ncbi:MAG: hypothetical protein IPK59_11930 [Rhodospirillaceae bacterium]|nr:hypothetical protein [Rhodospirillaceae bacterium]